MLRERTRLFRLHADGPRAAWREHVIELARRQRKFPEESSLNESFRHLPCRAVTLNADKEFLPKDVIAPQTIAMNALKDLSITGRQMSRRLRHVSPDFVRMIQFQAVFVQRFDAVRLVCPAELDDSHDSSLFAPQECVGPLGEVGTGNHGVLADPIRR